MSTEETDKLLTFSNLEMGGNDADERGKHSNSVGINFHDVEREEEDEDEDALSLCDLPINEENQLVSRKESPKPVNDSQEEFNFCSSLGTDSLLSKESEMCAADDVFFQGQILPLRHSVSSDSGFITKLQNDSRTTSRCISRSESMDRYCYSAGLSSVSSRSSSINSHHSSSSGTTSSTTTGTESKHKPRPKIRNQFEFSHPSPKPQIRSSNIKNGINGNNSTRKSTLWSIFRVGLVTTPEIAIQDLKFRTSSKTSLGSRNSTSSNSISSSTFSNSSAGKVKADEEEQMKKKQKFFDKHGVVFFSGCKCSSKPVMEPISSRVIAENGTRRSASSVNEAHADEEEVKKLMRTTNQRQHRHQAQAGKQSLSRHRTFEWLKQLSLESPAVIDEA